MIVVGTLTGAFGAHALDGVLPEQSMGSFEVASRYGFNADRGCFQSAFFFWLQAGMGTGTWGPFLGH